MPKIQVKWGPYFKQDAEEKLKTVELIQAALGKGGTGERLITTELAVSKVAELFDVEDTESLLEQLESEKAEREAKEAERAEQEREAIHTMAAGIAGGKNPAGDRRPGGGQQAKAFGGRGGAAATAAKAP